MEVTDPPIDFLALSAAMGVPAARADGREAIAAAAKRAFARSGPSLIEIPVK
jgi:thiamine pyrophosphate-dependent acetolactate synthase large subunit-like protein